MWHKQKQENDNKKQDIIVDLLRKAKQDGRGMCVSLIGAWGVGKTHRWETDIKSCFKGNEVIYISGFGKTTLSEFKLELLDKLLKAKGWLSKFLTGFVIIAISTFIIGGVIFNITGGIEDKHWFWITLSVIVGISFLGAIFFYSSLIKYFSNKILGVDHNNIDFKNIWTSKEKPILCFDDIERVVFSENISGILGFVEELKNIGYPILLITNPTKDDAGMWKKFKEKVVNRTFEQLPEKETFDKVMAKYQSLDDMEKKYLEEIFNVWSKTVKNKELVNENDFEIIFEHIKSNFRLLEAIINNILFVKDKVNNYAKLDEHIKLSLLSYIGLYTVIKFLELSETQIYTKEEKYIDDSKDQEATKIRLLYNNVVTSSIVLDSRIPPKRFGNLVVVQEFISFDKLVPVKKLLDRGYIEHPIVFADSISETEKIASNFPLLRSRTPQIKEFVNNVKKVVLVEETPFSSINSMGNILTNLCICYELLGKTFNKNDLDWLLPVMEKVIQKESLQLGNFIHSYNYLIHLAETPDNSYHYCAGKYLNDVYIRYGIDNVIRKIKQSDDFFEEFMHCYMNSNIEYLAYLYVLYSDKTKQKELSDMKINSYTEYVHVMDYLTVSVNRTGLEEYAKKLSKNGVDFMPKLKNILKKEIKSIENLPDAGLNEHNISKTLLERFIAKKKA